MKFKVIIVLLWFFISLSILKIPYVSAYSSPDDNLIVTGSIIDGIYLNTGTTTPNGDYIYKNNNDISLKWNDSEMQWEFSNESGDIYYYAPCLNPTCTLWIQGPLGTNQLPSLIWEPIACSYRISSTSGDFSFSAENVTVSISASGSECSWTSSNNLSWVNVSPSSGTGSGTVTVSVTANTGAARSGSIIIAGQPYVVSQAGRSVQKAVTLTKTSPNHTIISGKDVQVYGTGVSNKITTESGAKAELINFPGFNTIQIQSNSDGFRVSRSGTVVTFQGTDGTVLKIPASTSVQTISFLDRTPLTLSIYQGKVMLDDQVIHITPTKIENVDQNTSFLRLSEIILKDNNFANKKMAIDELFRRADLEIASSLQEDLIQNLVQEETNGSFLTLEQFYNTFSEKLFTVGPEINSPTSFQNFLEFFNIGLFNIKSMGVSNY